MTRAPRAGAPTRPRAEHFAYGVTPSQPPRFTDGDRLGVPVPNLPAPYALPARSHPFSSPSCRNCARRRARYAEIRRFLPPSGDGQGLEALFLDLRRFSDAITEVVELRPADVAAGDDLDLGEDRRVHREGALDADAEAHLAHGEGLAGAAALAADDRALEDLDPLTGAFDHAHVDLQAVAGSELGNVVAQL